MKRLHSEYLKFHSDPLSGGIEFACFRAMKTKSIKAHQIECYSIDNVITILETEMAALERQMSSGRSRRSQNEAIRLDDRHIALENAIEFLNSLSSLPK